MAHERNDDLAAGTQLDSRTARARLQEGLVPGDTGIYLRIEEGVDVGKMADLSSGGVYLIGRENTELELNDDKVSRKHAEIGLYGPGAYVLRDLASTNGTFVNGKRVTEKVKLKHQDLIRIGDTLIRFAQIDDSVPVSQ